MQGLPPELLSEIFIACMPPLEETEKTIQVRKPSSAPLLLCQVCASWRDVAINTPQLWQIIPIFLRYTREQVSYPPRWLECSNPSEIHFLELWGSRCGALPPSIYFLSLGVKSMKEVEHDRDIWVSFREMCTLDRVYSRQWQVLALCDASPKDVALLVGRLADDGFPNLEYLVVSGCCEGMSQAEWTEEITSKGSSKLKRVYFEATNGYGSEPFRKHQAIHWDRLTHLAISKFCISESDWRSFLRQCTSLTHLIVSLYVFPGEDPLISTNQTIQPNLQEITLEVAHEDVSVIFKGFLFPSVVKFRLSFGVMDAYTDSELTFIHDLLSSTPNVEELHAQYWFPEGSPTKLINFLEGQAHHQLDRQDLPAVHIPPLSRVLPNLRTFIIDGTDTGISDRAVYPLLDELTLILDASWLLTGWSQSAIQSRVTILILVNEAPPRPDVSMLAHNLRDRVHIPSFFNLDIVLVNGSRWNWKTMSGHDLRFGWERCSAWLDESNP